MSNALILLVHLTILILILILLTIHLVVKNWFGKRQSFFHFLKPNYFRVELLQRSV